MKSKWKRRCVTILFGGKRLVPLSACFNPERKREVCTGWDTGWRKIADVDAVV